MAFEAIRASSFSFAQRQVEQAVECSGAHSLDKKFFKSAVATLGRSARSASGGFRSRPGTGTRASHILHIIGSSAGHRNMRPV